MNPDLTTFLARSPLPVDAAAAATNADLLISCASPSIAEECWMKWHAQILRSAWESNFDRIRIKEPSGQVEYSCATRLALRLENDREFGR